MSAEIICGKLKEAWESIIQCWQYKIAVSLFSNIITFLFGEIDVGFIALWSLVFLDLFSRWACVTKKHIEDSQLQCGWIAGFLNAWETGVLNSREMRFSFVPKIGVYLGLLIAAHLLTLIIQPKVLLGVEWSQVPANVVTMYLAITEFMSINENFVEMGYGFLAPLSRFFCKKRDSLVGNDNQDTGDKRQ